MSGCCFALLPTAHIAVAASRTCRASSSSLRFDHLIAETPELRRDDPTHIRLILDHKNAFSARGARQGFIPGRTRSVHWLLVGGEIEPHSRPLSRLALDQDIAA